jgi:N-acetyltransferase B complex (NatB) non catalytic subunit
MSEEISIALERKLKSIHDLIESKQYKKALKQCNSCLKKSDSLVILATKSFVLQRLGEEQESFAILEDIVARKPTNPNILELLTITYKALNRYDRLNQIYSDEFARNPSRETGEILFNSYSSVYNFHDQYQISLKLYKTFGDLKYGILAIESMCLVAMHDSSQKKLLDLATLFFNKVKLHKDFLASKEMIELEILIESLKGKDLDVIRILQASLDVVSDGVVRQADIHVKQGNYMDGIQLYSSLFSTQEATPDLGLFLKFIDTVLKTVTQPVKISINELLGQNPNKVTEPGKPGVLSSYSLLDGLLNTPDVSRNFKRTVIISIFYLLSSLARLDYISDISSIISPKFEDYIKEYHDIPSVVEDIKDYLSILPQEKIENLINSLKSLYKNPITNTKELLSTLAYLKLCYKFELLPPDYELLSLYMASLNIEPEPKKGEHRLGDQIMMMIVKQYPSTSFIPQFLLEYGIPRSPYNYFLKLQLIETYKSTEFCKKIIELYENLDIKSVQHESLSYLVFSELNDWRLWKNELFKISNSIEKFHRYYAIDLAESTSQAYIYHHIPQILDFAQFKNKIDNSLYFHMTQVSNIYVELAKKIQEGTFKTNTDFIHTDLSSFINNTDTNVMNDYLLIREKPNTDVFGRWNNLKYFDFERYAAGFVCEFSAENIKYLDSLNKIKDIVGLIESNDIYHISYQVIATLAEILSDIKSSNTENIVNNMKKTVGILEKLYANVVELDIFKRFLLKESFLYENFIPDLKKIVFIINTYTPVVSFILNFIKKHIPESKKSKKSKQNPNQTINELAKLIVSNVFTLIDYIISILSSEDYLNYIDTDQKTLTEISRIPLEINTNEKVSESIQSKRSLIKEICIEIHSIRATSFSLLK